MARGQLGKRERVCAVVVTYQPDLYLLETVLEKLSGQVAETVVVDNTPDGVDWRCSSADESTFKVIGLGRNCGIATGHNVGIRWAREQRFSHVLLMDQDSIPAPDMVARLLAVERKLRVRGERVAAVAPRFFDSKYPQPAPFIKRAGWRIRKISCESDLNGVHQVEYAISSGTLIAVEILDEIGEMEDGLFIDYVDIEWGLRAQSKGYYCFGVCAAHMEHHLGDATVTFRWAKDFRAPVRSPLRHYYHFRNAVHLYKRSYVPAAWAVNDAYRLLLKYVFYTLVTPPRWQHFKMMTLGIWHGLCGRVGPLPTTTGPAG